MTETLKYKVGDTVKTFGEVVTIAETDAENCTRWKYFVRDTNGYGWWTAEVDLEPVEVAEKQEEKSMAEVKDTEETACYSEPPVKQLDSYTAQVIQDYFVESAERSDDYEKLVKVMEGFFGGLWAAGVTE